MVVPGMIYLFVASFSCLLLASLGLKANKLFKKTFIFEFLKTFNPLLVLGFFYLIGIIITQKIPDYALRDILEFGVNIFMLFVLFFLMHYSEKRKGFLYVFRKITSLIGISAVLISLAGIIKYILQIQGVEMSFENPLGTAFNTDKNFYALYSFLGLISFYPRITHSNNVGKQLFYQMLFLVLIANIILSFSFRSVLLLSFIFITVLFLQTYRLISSKSEVINNLTSNLWLVSIALLIFFTVNITILSIDQDYSNRLTLKYTSENLETDIKPDDSKIITKSFNYSKWEYALEIFKQQKTTAKLFGNGFNYFEKYGEHFSRGQNKFDYPHNPVLSALLYSGILGAVFTLFFIIIAVYYSFIYFKKYPLFSMMLFICLLFVFFSGNSMFSVPIFLFLFSLSFLIRHQEISELKINENLSKPGSKMLKETFDYVLAIIALMVLAPILIIASILIIFSMGYPFIFSQDRVGQNGKIFKLHKFRSMKKMKSNTSVAAREQNRITKLGHFLRNTKLDELPELWNIIRGDMSFVGPRPDVPGYADNLIGDDRRILELKPGLTGPASLKYKNEEELLQQQDDPQKYNDEVIFPDKVKINKAYMEKWSLWLDLKIILYTAIGKSLKENNF